MADPDAVVIGAGPNGLVAANLLADAGWRVCVLEAQDHPGGAVHSDRGVHPDYISDTCSAFYPLSAASPVIEALDLPRYGLRWRHGAAVLAHPLPDGRAAVLHRDLDATATALDGLAAGDGEAWRRLHGLWRSVTPPLLDALFTPFPPVRAGLRLAARLRAAGGLRLARLGLLPVRRLLEEEFTGPGGLLLAGNALHADLAPESAGSAMFGWLLSMLGQDVGYPVPAGGAGELAGALVRRLTDRGGELVCGARVTRVEVRRGRAVAVRTADGRQIAASRAVLADVDAPQLYGGLVDWSVLPARLRDDLRRFQWDYATVKVDWALSGPVPWAAPGVAGAGTVHLAADLDEMTEYAAQIAMGQVPAHPFVLVGQMTTADASRSPSGTESLWAYTHVPRRVRGDPLEGVSGRWDERDAEAMAERLTDRLEAFAPGFRDRVLARRVLTPTALERHDRNLSLGALNGGTTSAHQQLLFRPTPGLGRPETPVAGLFLASASAHPGGGVHGACGANAARAALRSTRASNRLIAATDRALRRGPARPRPEG